MIDVTNFNRHVVKVEGGKPFHDAIARSRQARIVPVSPCYGEFSKE
jgi:hypothetical protein